MNLIRLIKLKKINGELDNLSEQERYFLSLFDGLVFDNDYYIKNGKSYFCLNINRNTFLYSYHNVSLPIKRRFSITSNQVEELVDTMLNEKLNLNYFILSSYHLYHPNTFKE